MGVTPDGRGHRRQEKWGRQPALARFERGFFQRDAPRGVFFR